jgi:ABC-type amino acid transport substrate-binding protein
MRAICAQLGLALQPVRYSGADFNGIFDGLAKRSYDAVISGTLRRTGPPSRCFRSLISNSTRESRSIGARRRTSRRSPICAA